MDRQDDDKGMDEWMQMRHTTNTTTGACVQWVSGRATQDNVKHASGTSTHAESIHG